MQNICALLAHLLDVLNDDSGFTEVICNEREISHLLLKLIGFPYNCVIVLGNISCKRLRDSCLEQCVLVALLDRDCLENIDHQIVSRFLFRVQQPAVVDREMVRNQDIHRLHPLCIFFVIDTEANGSYLSILMLVIKELLFQKRVSSVIDFAVIPKFDVVRNFMVVLFISKEFWACDIVGVGRSKPKSVWRSTDESKLVKQSIG